MSKRDLLAAVLAPIARFCLRSNIHFTTLSDSLKTILVKLASAEIGRAGEKVTTSRVSIMTGITRREVRRILKEEGNVKEEISFTARVINRWQNDRPFVGKNGKPRRLTHSSYDGEFQRLCESVSQDVNPGTVLKELERRNIVETKNGLVQLLQTESDESVVPVRGMKVLMDDIDTLCQVAEENIFRPKPIKNLHYRTEFDNIDVHRLEELRTWFLEHGGEIHRAARELLSRYDKDLNPHSVQKGGGKVVFATFSWTEPPSE